MLMSEGWWVKYYLTWLLVSLLFMVCKGRIHSLATLIMIFFFGRNALNTCDSAYRCACKHVQAPGVQAAKLCVLKTSCLILFLLILLYFVIFTLSFKSNRFAGRGMVDGAENKEVPEAVGSRMGSRAAPLPAGSMAAPEPLILNNSNNRRL